MVVEELGEEGSGEPPHLRRVRRPHGRGLRDEQPLDEVVRVAAVREEATERRPWSAAADELADLAVESDQIAQHAVKTGVERVCRAREQPPWPGGRPLEPTAAVRDGEAHVGRLGGDPELGQHALEVRVVELVEDDEAGVDRQLPPGCRDVDRVGVPTRIFARLEDVDVMSRAVELRGGDEAGDTGPDDGDPPLLGDVPHLWTWTTGSPRTGLRSRSPSPSFAFSPMRLKIARRGTSSSRRIPRSRRSASQVTLLADGPRGSIRASSRTTTEPVSAAKTTRCGGSTSTMRYGRLMLRPRNLTSTW